MSLADDFKRDLQGQKFADVWKDTRIDFHTVCEFYEDRQRRRRLVDSETHHDRPALAGVVREFENLREVHQLFTKYGREDTRRFRQAVGVLVRIVMEQHGWKTTGRKGSLGTPAKSAAGKRRLGGANKGGLAQWFNRAERYAPVA